MEATIVKNYTSLLKDKYNTDNIICLKYFLDNEKNRKVEHIIESNKRYYPVYGRCKQR